MDDLTRRLRDGSQADMDGVFVTISREVVEKAAAEIERLRKEVEALRAHCASLQEQLAFAHRPCHATER